MAAYQVDPDALFSDEDSPPRETPPRIARPQPTQSTLRPLTLPPLGRSSVFSKAPSLSNGPFSGRGRGKYESRPYESGPYGSRPHNSRPYDAHRQDGRSYNSAYSRATEQSRPPPLRGLSAYQRPNTSERSDVPQRPMGRGRAMTLPAHVTKNKKAESPKKPDSLSEAVSILPEHTREKVLREEEKRRAAAASERKRPSRRRRPEDPSVKKAVLQNAKRSRQGQSMGLASLLAAASNSDSIIRLDPNRNRTHREHRATSERAFYEGVTMTKERKEREERERLEAERKRIDEEQAVDEHFRQMRIQERNERRRLADKWRRQETVAAGMRHVYRLAKIERSLFCDPNDKNKDSLSYLGLALRSIEEDATVTELMTIEVEEI